jgi:shikimate kinase/3-dehydroquinate synthase
LPISDAPAPNTDLSNYPEPEAHPGWQGALAPENLILFGPPGSGKSAVGVALAHSLDREFVDTDARIETETGKTISEIFRTQGEAGFRSLEAKLARSLAARAGLVIACGGGMLLNQENRRRLEGSGRVIFLDADLEAIRHRLSDSPHTRPLLAADREERLKRLLSEREAVYRSFPERVDTTRRRPDEVGRLLAAHYASPSPHSFEIVQPPAATHGKLGLGALEGCAADLAECDLHPPLVILADSNVAALYARKLAPSLGAETLVFPAGEQHKTLDTAARLYAGLLDLGMDRHGTVLALGGGVTGDLAGFVAATFMRGLRWVDLPTSSLAMIDASLGGKVGVDLPQGKNLVGAFHPPALILADTTTLNTLPPSEFHAGIAELVKAALIADPLLFEWLEIGGGHPTQRWLERAQQVKIDLVQRDPFERGVRAALNLGHTVAHGLEAASGYGLRHGDAVAVGMLAEARMAEAIGLAAAGLADRVQAALANLDLPTRAHGISWEAVRGAMQADKKRRAREIRFSLPRAVGEVETNRQVPQGVQRAALKSVLED